MSVLVEPRLFADFCISFVGIYCIHNTFHDMYYIGSSTDMFKRLDDHRCDLSFGRHKNQLLQQHFSEIKQKGLEPSDFFIARPIYMRRITFRFSESSQQNLINNLEMLEHHYQEIFKQIGYQIYNTSTLLVSQLQVANFITRLNNLNPTKISSFVKTRTFDRAKLGSCVKIYRVGVFPNVSSALETFNAINSGQTPLPLTTFRRYLNEQRFPDVLQYISLNQYDYETKNKVILTKDQEINMNFEEPVEPSNIQFPDSEVVNPRSTCIQVFKKEGRGVYPSLEKAAKAMKMGRSTISGHFKRGFKHPDYKEISRKE